MSTIEILFIILGSLSFAIPAIPAIKVMLNKNNSKDKQYISAYFICIATVQLIILAVFIINISIGSRIVTAPLLRIFAPLQLMFFIWLFLGWMGKSKFVQRSLAILFSLAGLALDLQFYTLEDPPEMMLIFNYIIVAVLAIDSYSKYRLSHQSNPEDIDRLYYQKTFALITAMYAANAFLVFGFWRLVPQIDSFVTSVLYVYINYRYAKTYKL